MRQLIAGCLIFFVGVQLSKAFLPAGKIYAQRRAQCRVTNFTYKYIHCTQQLNITTISDKNFQQGLPFPSTPPPVHPLPNVVLEIRQNTERKVDIIVTTLKQGKLSKVGMSKITSKDVLTLFRLGFLRVVQLGGGGGGSARGL